MSSKSTIGFSHASGPFCCDADIIIVGAGISGTLAATVLSRAGYRITLVDRHSTYPSDFRAEHLDGTQIEQLTRLGLLDGLVAGLYRGETVVCGRRGRVVDVGKTVNFGIRYEAMVNTARRLMPETVTTVTGRVVDVVATDNIQQVRLAEGGVLTSRLVILASGLGYALCRKSGITRKMLREAHSLTFGFNLVSKAVLGFQHSFVVYEGEKLADKIDYLAAFRMGEHTRVNLFTYRNYRDEWTTAFRSDPNRVLQETLPGLRRVIGGYEVVGKVDARAMDLYVSESHRQDGVVLIGDAFQTSCPAAGFGITRLLTDIERVCVHIPEWFRTPGMGADKLASFYSDPTKRACDARATHDAEYRRSVSVEPGLNWVVHRQQVLARRRLRAWTKNRVAGIRSLRNTFAGNRPTADSGLLLAASTQAAHGGSAGNA